jgi:hypothetical protein
LLAQQRPIFQAAYKPKLKEPLFQGLYALAEAAAATKIPPGAAAVLALRFTGREAAVDLDPAAALRFLDQAVEQLRSAPGEEAGSLNTLWSLVRVQAGKK